MEAAIILPVIMLLTFGAIEFGIAFSQRGGLESAGRSGARLASTETSADNPLPTGIYLFAHTQIGVDTAVAVNAALGQSTVSAVTALYVYRINGTTGLPDGFTGIGNPCGSNCIQFQVSGASKRQFDVTTPTGDWGLTDGAGASVRIACPAPGVVPDRVGVSLRATFQFFTSLLGLKTVPMTVTAILQLEPTNCSG